MLFMFSGMTYYLLNLRLTSLFLLLLGSAIALQYVYVKLNSFLSKDHGLLHVVISYIRYLEASIFSYIK